MSHPPSPRSPRQTLGVILFATLALSAVYSLVRVLITPEGAAHGGYANTRSDYLLMLLQCVLGLAVFALPSLLEHKWRLEIPNFIYVMYYVFLYCAIFLGEVMDFYYLVPHWDTILHFFSGAMLGALGFILVSVLNDSQRVPLSLSPGFVALFSFCFALSCGAVWEIYEYTFDGLLGLNMQKFVTAAGETLSGRAALEATMKDLIVDACAAAAMSLMGYLRIRKGQKRQSP